MSMRYFQGDSANEVYLQIIKSISETPDVVSTPRGMEIKETLGAVVHLNNTLDSLITLSARKLNYAFAAIEKLEYLSGQTDSKRLTYYNKNFASYSNRLGYFDGAYAERLQYWYKHIVSLLKTDPDSRQAVMTIYGPQDRHETKDVPCTVMFQFILRKNKLNMITYMRSNDVLWGFPYDTNGFCLIQQAIASLLGVELGWYELHVGSLHIYTERENQLLSLLDDQTIVGYRNPIIADYSNCEYSQLQNDINKFWVAESAYRLTNSQSNVVDELPSWLLEYYQVVVQYINAKNYQSIPL